MIVEVIRMLNIPTETTRKKKIEGDPEIDTMFENLRLLRQARGWTIEELSKRSGIRVKILTDIEEGRDFDIVYLIRLCNLYHIQPNKIFSHIEISLLKEGAF